MSVVTTDKIRLPGPEQPLVVRGLACLDLEENVAFSFGRQIYVGYFYLLKTTVYYSRSFWFVLHHLTAEPSM